MEKIIDKKTVEKIYAGWLGKLIGVRSGAAIEMWSAEQIAEKYGEIDGYPEDFDVFAADDDTNGTIFSLQAFFDCGEGLPTSADFGRAVLNYAPYEHGYFWWGGYGISAEHTAYLNMRSGVMPPASGSMTRNGRELSEQIGGQIFSDIYGLSCPYDYRKAADIAESAARVTHDGEAVLGGRFVAACISAAFACGSVGEMIEKGLSVIPADSQYATVVRDMIRYYGEQKTDFRAALEYVRANYWKDKFGGNCHIIPNIAIMILALMYGEGDFDKSVNICNMCGFDTDCNTSNIAVMLGVLLGLDSIAYDKWRRPVNDLTNCSSVLGSMNIVTAPQFVARLVRAAEKVTGARCTEKVFTGGDEALCHFELPGSTHAFESETAVLSNDGETAYSGSRSLKARVPDGENYIFRRTYYGAEDMHDNRYDPVFSPLVYPGQRIECAVRGTAAGVALYVKDRNSGRIFRGERVVPDGEWRLLSFDIPADSEGVCISEAGLIVSGGGTVNIDDFLVTGAPSYVIDFSKERIEYYALTHQEVSQFAYYKGYWRLEDGCLFGTAADVAECYTGGGFGGLDFEVELIPAAGRDYRLLFGVKGALGCYSAGFTDGRLSLSQKTDGNYTELGSVPFNAELGKSYVLRVRISESVISLSVDGAELLRREGRFADACGRIGAGTYNGSACKYRFFKINK